MKPITINLIGETSGPALGALGELNIDPALIITGVVGLLVALIVPNLIGVIIDNFLINPANAQISQLQQSIGSNKGRAIQLTKLQKQLNSLEGDYSTLLSLAKESSTWKSVLEEIRDLTPTDLWLTSLSIDGGQKLHMSGAARSYQAIAFFYTNLQNAETLSHPVLGNLQSDEIGNQQIVRFSVDCDIKPRAGG